MNNILRMMAQRISLGLLTLFIVSLIIFLGVSMLPGDAAQAILGQAATPDTLAALRKQLGLDLPPHTRYIQWLGGILQGDFGTSIGNGREIGEVIGVRFANTIFLAAFAACIAIPLSLVMGILAALYRNSFYDRTVNALTLSSISTPEFFVAYILILFVSVKAGWFPSLSNIQGDTTFLERLNKTLLPAITLTLVSVAHMMRMTRAALINLLSQSYIEMAESEGYQEIEDNPAPRPAQCLGADRQCHRAEPGLPDRRRGGSRGGLCLPGSRAIAGRCSAAPRHAGGAGLLPDFRGHLRVA